VIVVDASAITEFLLQTPLGVRVEARLFLGTEEFHAPHLLDVEVAQALRRLVRMGEVRPNRAREAVEDLTVIAGQKPIITRAGNSIAGFKLREGQAIGTKVTLRGDRMWEFFDRLITLAVPRIRDFRGLNPRSFDGRGNYTFGLSEQLMFPEINYDTVDAPRGMDITIVTTADNDAAGRALLEAFNFPFRREGQAQ